MNKTILLLFIISTSYFTADAQSPRIIAHIHEGIAGGVSVSKDSFVFTYSGNRGGYDKVAPNALGFDQSIEYDLSNSLLSRNVLTYDAADRLLETIIQIPNGAGWINSQRWYNIYDAAGNNIESGSQQWDTGTQAWQSPSNRGLYTFDAQHRQVSRVLYYGNSSNLDSVYYDQVGNITRAASYLKHGTGTYEVSEIEFYKYSNSGKTIESLFRNFSSGFLQMGRDTFVYDIHDSLLALNYFRWSSASSVWQMSARERHEYNALGNDTAIYKDLADTITATWIPDRRELRKFDTDHNVSESVFQTYDTVWNNQYRLSMFYNIRHQQTFWQYASWNNGVWTNGHRVTTGYRPDGYPIEEIHSSYDFTTGTFAPNDRYTNIYGYSTGISEISQDLYSRAYPNPTHGSFDIVYSADKAGAATLVLYDLSGKLISLTESTSVRGENHLTWSAFPLSQGMYIYELSIPDAMGRGKLSVE
jgi:hypothetical protein